MCRRCIIISIDIKEHFAEYAKAKFAENDVHSDIINLPQSTGCDYLITGTYGSCGIQRKDSIAEICGTPVSKTKKFKSAMDELLHDILPRLSSFTDNPVLLVEESHILGERGYLFRRNGKHWVETGMHCSSYYGFLETVRNMGVDVVCTRNLDASLWYMISMHGYLERCHYPKHSKMFTTGQQAMGMLCCVPKIGEKRAMQALGAKSIAEMVNSKTVPGLTDIQVRNLQKVLKWKS